MKYWAFISYSHRDEAWAQWLHRAIETYRVPGRLIGRTSRDGGVPRRLYPIFRDRDELPTSSNLGENIIQALQESRYLIVICSPQSASSRWVDEEIKAFKAMGREDRVLCLIVGGEPNASDNVEAPGLECFPAAVRYRVNTEGQLTQERTEPIAADARQGKDEKADAKLKVLAGLLGVGFDELKQRERQRQRAGRLLGLVFTAIFGATLLLPNGPIPPVRLFTFDSYQRWFPRPRISFPGAIVIIDDESLSAVGQWPWPRDVTAHLIDRIAARKPAAIAVDILFIEPDSKSPERLAEMLRRRDPTVADLLARLRPNDEILAESIARAPVVLGIAGLNEGQSARPDEGLVQGDPAAALIHYDKPLRSLPLIDKAARGHGLLNSHSEGGIVRRMPLVAVVNGEPTLSFVLESIKVAGSTRDFAVTKRDGLVRVRVGDLEVPAQLDGRVWLYFSRHDPGRYISAATVLEGRDDPSFLESRVVLIGVNATGLSDSQTTAMGGRMAGIEIHAQLLENLVDDALLTRPVWSTYAEAFLYCLLAGLFIFGVPRWSSWRSVATLVVCSGLVVGGGTAAFLWGRVLLDPTQIVLGVTALFGLIMTYGFFSTSARQSGVVASRS